MSRPTVADALPRMQALAAVPTKVVTETVEDVEWRCAPLLAPAATGVYSPEQVSA
jgi:hypothetical protein